MPTPYMDGYNQPLDIGDYVQFIADGRYGTVFRIIQFTLNTNTALIYATPNKKYWIPTNQLRWIK